MKCIKFLAVPAGALGLLLILLPMSLQAQLMLSCAVLGVMFIGMTRPENPTFRVITLVFASIIALRYGFWRTTETLPDISEPLNFIPGFLLYLAEMYCLAMLAISFFMVLAPVKRKTPEMGETASLPTVDVFIPSYNEDAELLAITLAAAKSMAYPKDKLNIFLLDDGGTEAKRTHKDPRVSVAAIPRHEQLKALCTAMGVTYHARKKNDHAKAGNLNEGLKISTGELVVVFDADHAPVRDFLRETVGFFAKDEKLFLVQTPHYFLNPDPLEKNLKTFARMPSENEMFYSILQRGLDKWNASFFCGSAAVLRRAALETTDGFSGQSITEDCETALSLHCQGWHSVYVDKPLIAGLQPETFVSFIGQRARWCQGMLQILILKRPFLAKGLTIPQRICYAGINMFWLFPISRLAFMFSPLLYIFFSLEIYRANILEFASYAVTYLISSFAMQSYLYGRVRWPWISELYEYVQAVFLFGSIISVIRNPRKPTFNVTAKGQTLDKSMLSPLAAPYFAIFFLLLAAALYSGYRLLTEPVAGELLMIVAMWNLINLGLAGAALGAIAERRELRRNQRLPVKRHALIHIGEENHTVIIQDASSGGISVEFVDGTPKLDASAATKAKVELRRGGQAICFDVVCRSRRVTNGTTIAGFAYSERTPKTVMAIAELMYSDQSVLQDRLVRRQIRRNFFWGTTRFALWSITESLRAIRYSAGLVRETMAKSFEDAPLVLNDNKITPLPSAPRPEEATPVLQGGQLYG
ncbi:cellulose synthase (UDP-forming) [Pararhizobium capsulatum DSM 1112]|uniref:Cellulose synthase catalytic subunit [UDP-forming] n=1 Tax=Pararhizobium capsulatum DSM 1112 TaxID=1121113 RepID=A0ABU0BLW0_9HYPH|nr:UDP-forming cellulose synthase catalytic subunit [Pararhizobium capsulatum]MDQ0319219.1 cellulose synthase (UDP-forming) [Pararhizobium capsulatum DSM 1112]